MWQIPNRGSRMRKPFPLSQRKAVFVSGAVATTLVMGAVWLHAATAIGLPMASPAQITATIPTQVTITSQITGPNLISGGVNLLRIGANGTQILGVMQNTGGNTYTLQVTFNECTAGTIQLQVSAAFRGQLRRALSSIGNVPVGFAGLTQ